MAAARITGTVLATERRTGVAKSSGNEYDFTEVRVLVADTDIAVFTARGSDGQHFHRGDAVDVLVSQDVYGGRLSSTLVSAWPELLEVAA